MTLARSQRARPADLVAEISEMIVSRYPDAEIEVAKLKPGEYRMRFTADIDDLWDAVSLTSDRTADILVDHDIYIGVTPVPRHTSRN